MTFKTNRNQFYGLELLLRVLLSDNKPANIAERLVYSHTSKLYAKMRAKREADYLGALSWNVTMTDQEAWALYVFCSNVKIDEVEYKYESLNLQSIINQIHQKYNGEINRTNRTNRGLAAGTPTRRLGGKA